MTDRPPPSPVLGTRFRQALDRAVELHAGQARKGTRVPYVSHLLAAASLVLEDGGDEDHAIAALLHDAIEDQDADAAEIDRVFGGRVRRIVEACTDAHTKPKPPWRERKERFITRLADAPPDVLRVVNADKLHNARCILRDFRAHGGAVWQRFEAGRDGTLWYYRSLADVLGRIRSGPLAEELGRVVAELEAEAAVAARMGDGA